METTSIAFEDAAQRIAEQADTVKKLMGRDDWRECMLADEEDAYSGEGFMSNLLQGTLNGGSYTLYSAAEWAAYEHEQLDIAQEMKDEYETHMAEMN
jgi:hypothetical protein